MMYVGVLKCTVEPDMCQIDFIWNILHIRNETKHVGGSVKHEIVC
jgi:hypothetical protein